MRKKLLPLILLLGCIPTFAAKKQLQVKYNKNRDSDLVAHRSPMHLPISLYYDDETLTIEVSGPTELEAEIYIYDADNILEDYSPCINTVLTITDSPYHTVVIEGNSWSGTAGIE